MKNLLFCTLLLLVGVTLAGEVLQLDNFFGDQTIALFGPDEPKTADFLAESADPSASFIGGERDLIADSFDGTTITSDVFASVGQGVIGCFVGPTINGTAWYQLDGFDSSDQVTVGNYQQNIIVGGATGMLISHSTDIDTTVRVSIFGASLSSYMEIFVPIPPSNPNFIDTFLPYASFTQFGGFDPNVNDMTAIEIQLNTDSLVDVDVQLSVLAFFANEIQGCAFVDCDANQVQDDDDQNFNGVTMELTNTDTNTVISTQLTAFDGCFTFTVDPGNYEVCAQVPNNFQLTTPQCRTANIPIGTFGDVTGLTYGFSEPLTIISTPQDVTLPCANVDTSTGNTGTIFVEDCEPATITSSDARTDFCTGQFTITRTFTATDGTTTLQYTQIIEVVDTVAPVFNAFDTSNQNLNCGDDTSPASLGTPTATDDCSSASVSFLDSVPNGGCTDPIQRTWTATDACGNFATITQLYTIQDTTAPTFGVFPNDATLDCQAGTDPANTGGTPTATDNCGGAVTITFTDGPVSGGCNPTFTRTWFATDGCNNVATRTQQITRTDSTAPVLTLNNPVVDVDCGDSTSTNVIPGATATDDCNAAVVSSSDGPLSGDCPTTFARTFSATDNCNTPSTTTQIIRINDNIAPTFVSFPVDVNGACNGSTLPSTTGTPTATDQTGCSGLQGITSFDVTSGDSCNFVISRVWTATDNCGNSVTDTQTISLVDTVAPVFSNIPGSVNVDCDEPTNVGATGIPTAFDDCQNTATSVGTSDTIVSQSANQCTTTIARTFTTADVCGNDNSITQTIIVTDLTGPTVTAPADTTLACTGSDGANVDPSNTGGVASVTDNCDLNPTVTFIDTETGSLTSGSCEIIITRTWIGTDNCGLTDQDQQIITITNQATPVVIAPADTSIQCNEPSDPTNTGGFATVSAQCDPNAPLTFEDSPLSSASCPSVFTRTWISMDACGNDVRATQTISIVDSTPPVFDSTPADITVNCTDSTDPSFTGTPQVSDNCNPNLNPTYTDTILNGGVTIGLCPAPDTIIRVWTVSDGCNTATSTQQIFVEPTGEQECTPVDCSPVQCDPSNCPTTSCDCCSEPATQCTPVNCNAGPCLPVDCLAVPCSGCTEGSAVPSTGCQPRPCEPQIIYVDDDDLNSSRMENEQVARALSRKQPQQMPDDSISAEQKTAKRSAASSFTVFTSILIALSIICAYLF